MIPLKLQLKNFLSYGNPPQTVDFEPYQLICLSGKNGHGKSALLDAITWAIWGQARKIGGTHKADEGLVRLGQSSMMVSLDFICNNTTYRIRREYAYSSSKPYALLDFGIIEPDTRALRSLTDKTIKITQDKINDTLGLEFETFVNSAFLRQGQSNEFSKKTSKERKEVLGAILGLEYYEKIRKKVLEKIGELKNQKEHNQKLLERLQLTLNQKNILVTQGDTLKQLFSTIQTSLAALIHEQSIISQEQQSIITVQKEHALQDFLYQELLKKQKEQEAKFCELVSLCRTVLRKQRVSFNLEQLTKDQSALEVQIQLAQKNYAQKNKLKEELFILKEQQQKLYQELKDSLTKSCNTLQAELHEERIKQENVSTQLLQLEQRVSQYTEEITGYTNQIEIIKKNNELKKVCPEFLAAQESQFEKRKQYYHKYIAKGQWVQQELQNGAQKKEFVNKTAADCPLCEQNLADSYKKNLYNKLVLTENHLLYRHKRLAFITKKLKDILVEQHAFIEHTKKQVQELHADTLKLQEYTHKKDALQKKQELLEQEKKTIQANCFLQQEKTALLQKQLLELQNKIDSLGSSNEQLIALEQAYKNKEQEFSAIIYSQEQYNQLIADLESLKQQEKSYTELLFQAQLQQERKKEIHQLNLSLKALKKEKSNLEQILDAKKLIDSKEQLLVIKEKELLEKIKNNTQEKELLLQQLGALDEQEKMIQKAEEEYKQIKETVIQQDKEQYRYQLLSTALSKDGIQALLIEDAIPEIEHEANAILSRLTDNQAQLSIESVKDLKSGGLKETLEIKISDGIGIRPYELFSGGEAFRIDFALRIAISKLLARRAGTALQTLIIDEGFGSQDEEGLNNIMEALYKIQDDFSKIIIVSHLPAMKDQFPVHFIVQKGANGSFVRVLEQG